MFYRFSQFEKQTFSLLTNNGGLEFLKDLCSFSKNSRCTPNIDENNATAKRENLIKETKFYKCHFSESKNYSENF